MDSAAAKYVLLGRSTIALLQCSKLNFLNSAQLKLIFN